MKIPRQQYWDLLAKYLKPQTTKVLLLAVLLFSQIGLQLFNPQIRHYFVGAAQSGGAHSLSSLFRYWAMRCCSLE